MANPRLKTEIRVMFLASGTGEGLTCELSRNWAKAYRRNSHMCPQNILYIYIYAMPQLWIRGNAGERPLCVWTVCIKIIHKACSRFGWKGLSPRPTPRTKELSVYRNLQGHGCRFGSFCLETPPEMETFAYGPETPPEIRGLRTF